MAGTVTPLNNLYPEQKMDKVTTYDLINTLSGGYPRTNTDQLVGQKGLQIYSLMANDEQVKAVMNFKRDAITARGWTFKCRDDSPLSETERAARIAVMNECVKRMKGSFSDALNMIMTGRAYGFSVTEKVYAQLDINGKQWTGINRLLGRDPVSFFFYTDDYGILDKIEQRVTGKPPLNVDQRRVIHYVHSPEWDHVFGRSDLREAYNAYYAKTQIRNLWLLYLEKFAGGTIVAKRISEDAPRHGTPEYQSLQDALKNWKSLGSVILPQGVEADIHMPASTDAYEKAVTFHDLAIAKALLVPNLLGISHAGQTGAYSQSQTQLEAFFWTLNADAQRLEACLNEQLFQDLGDQNWGDGEYPEFFFKPASLEHVKWVVTTWTGLLGVKAVIPTEEDEAYLRKLLELPPRDEKSTPLPQPEPIQPGKPVGEDKPKDDPVKDSEGYAKVGEQIAALQAEIAKLGAATRDAGTPHIHTPAAHAAPNSKQMAFSRAMQRVAFSVIEKRTDDAAVSNVDRIAGLMATAIKRVMGSDDQLKELTDDDPSDIAALAFNSADIGKVKNAAKDALMQGWRLGQDMALTEVERAKGERFSREKRSLHFKNLRDQATAYFELNGFRMAGNLSDGSKAIIQQELAAAVRYGTPLPEVRAKIWDRLTSKGFTSRGAVKGVEDDQKVLALLDDLWVEAEGSAVAYLNTLVRTNVFEAMNEARFAEFTDPELDDFVLALQYAAVLDSSTTQICEHLNARTYKADSEIWDEYRPPNHYNCRSVLVPITAIDGWDGRESDPPSIEPQDGF